MKLTQIATVLVSALSVNAQFGGFSGIPIPCPFDISQLAADVLQGETPVDSGSFTVPTFGTVEWEVVEPNLEITVPDVGLYCFTPITALPPAGEVPEGVVIETNTTATTNSTQDGNATVAIPDGDDAESTSNGFKIGGALASLAVTVTGFLFL